VKPQGARGTSLRGATPGGGSLGQVLMDLIFVERRAATSKLMEEGKKKQGRKGVEGRLNWEKIVRHRKDQAERKKTAATRKKDNIGGAPLEGPDL